MSKADNGITVTSSNLIDNIKEVTVKIMKDLPIDTNSPKLNTSQKTDVPDNRFLLSEKNWQVVQQMNIKFPQEKRHKGKSRVFINTSYKFICDIDLTR
jgi:hypothetical protein